jgi:tetratricopeptide (TPR) repeat protein
MNNDDMPILHNLYAASTNQSGTGLTLYNCGDVEINNLQADYLNSGIESYTSNADIVNSVIFDNNTGLSAQSASNIKISHSSFCGTGLDLYAYNFSSIRADSCSYDGGTPSISSSGGSTVQSYWNQGCSSPSIINPGESVMYKKVNGGGTPESEFKEINASYFSLNKKLRNALKAKTAFDKESFCTEYDNLIKGFREYIGNNPDSLLAKIALLNSTRCYRRIDDLRGGKDLSNMKSFILDVKGSEKYLALKPQAERLMVDYYKAMGDFTIAVATADSLLGKYKGDEDYTCDIMYAKGLILAHNLNQPDKAAESFSQIMQQYPKNGLSRLAENELRIMGKEVDKQIGKNTPGSVAGFALLENYPNPFNPTTNITFTLPQKSNVKLVVYDVLGKEVATLANSNYEAGKYSFTFNGSNLASGMYFYTLTTSQGIITKKMMLVK